LMGDAIEVADGVTAGILQLELKATKAADALDGGGFEHGNQAAIGREQETAEFGREVGHDVGSGVAFAAPLIGGLVLTNMRPGWRRPRKSRSPLSRKSRMIRDWKP